MAFKEKLAKCCARFSFILFYFLCSLYFIAITRNFTSERSALKSQLSEQGFELETSIMPVALGWTVTVLMIFTTFLGIVAFAKGIVVLVRTVRGCC